MAKKASKKAKARKSTSRSPRMKGAARSAKSTRKGRRGGTGGRKPARKGVDLKEIKAQLEGVLKHLRRAPGREALAAEGGMGTTETTVMRMMSDIDDICASGECGGGMVFPPPPPEA